MSRTKGGTVAHARHRKIVKAAKGYYGRRKNVFKVATQAVDKAKTKIRSREEMIGGIRLWIYEAFRSGADPFKFIGLARGGQQVIMCI